MTYHIPLFDLNFDDEEERAVAETLRSRWISMGDQVTQLEESFQKGLQVEQAVATTNCTAALHMAMVLLGIGPGDEVIVPSLTFVATANCVRYVGATPVFADVAGFTDLTICPQDIKSKITGNTRAIIVMHYAGFACDMDPIMRIAREHRLAVVEDASHAPLAEYKGKKLGGFGDFGCFSFFSNKNMTTGEGGMLVTNNAEYAQRARLIRSHGMTTLSYERARGHATQYDVVELGFNYRMDNIRGAIGRVQFEKLKKSLPRRRELWSRYDEALVGIEDIIIPFKDSPHQSSHYIYPIVLNDSTVEKRDRVRLKLKEAGIETSVHYPAVHEFEIYKSPNNSRLEATEYLSRNLITLPFFDKLSLDQIDHISNTLNNILNP